VARFFVRFANDTSGASAIEYAMVASCIAMAVSATIALFGPKVLKMYTETLAGF
jgi:Flp pilus assembly pilin Flp